MDEQNKAAPAGGSVPAEAAPAPAAASIPNVPASWPGGFGAFKYSKKAVMLNLETLIILWVISVVLDVLSNLVLRHNPAIHILFALLLAPIAAANALAVIAGVRRQHLPIGDALSKAVSLWLKMIVLFVILGFIFTVSILLLVVPFFFVLPRVSLALYFLADKNAGVTDAIKSSWEITKGNAGKVYGIIGVSILMVLLMITIIGIPFSLYFLLMYAAAFAVLYEFLGKAQLATASVPVQPVAPAPPAPTTPTGPQPPVAPPAA